MLKLEKVVKQMLSRVFVFVAVVCPLLVLLAGVAFLGLQVYWWLQDGKWRPVSVLTMLDIKFGDSSFLHWLNTPESWLGLHDLVLGFLQRCPLSLSLVLLGLTLFTASFLITNFCEKIWLMIRGRREAHSSYDAPAIARNGIMIVRKDNESN